MRKHQQRQILDILETMKQAQSDGLYADCQEGALSLCDFIEGIEGKEGASAEAAALFVEYCELLFKASSGEIGEKALQKHLTRIENSVKSKLRPNRIEIVFISSKAAMSDALESIYLAAKADPACDAYFIPIPYYNRNNDGSFGEMCYEGADCYSDRIEITDWQTYNIEERRPDVIFTSAPYDAENYMTCVHPSFWCEKLCNFTDMLIYVPYFVLGESTVDEIHCITAGCIFAHKVVLQSEKVRDAFIAGFTKYFGDRYGAPKEKFIALGSPKFDAIINSKREDFQLPESWQKLINGKKVVLYNTSVTTILRGNEQYLKKLRDVLEMFQDRNDVVLWWRPHPLSEATYQSMRPRLLEEYEEIIETYKLECWGIFDDTSDLTRAIKCTDAYYGDASSLILLFQCTGNPVILTDYSKPIGFLEFQNLYDDGEFLWFTAINVNGLFKMDKVTYETRYMGSFSGELPSGWLYCPIICFESKLYFMPYMANDICIFDMESRKFEKVQLRDDFNSLINTKYRKNKKFWYSAVYRDYIFFFPYSYPAIVRYSTKTGKIDYIEDCIKYLDGKAVLKDAYFFGGGIVTLNSIAYLFCNNTKSIVSFDMESCKIRHTEQFVEADRTTKICFDGECIWLVNNTESDVIIKWNIDTGRKTKLLIDLLKFEQKEYRHYSVTYASGHVWLISFFGNKSIKINITSHRAAEIKEFEAGNSDGNDLKPQRYWFFQQVNNKFYSFDRISKNFVEYDITNNTLRKEVVTVPNVSHSKALVANIYEDLLMEKLNNAEKLSDYVIHEASLHISSSLIDLLLYLEQTNLNQTFSRQIEALANENSNLGVAGNSIYVYTKKYVLGT